MHAAQDHVAAKSIGFSDNLEYFYSWKPKVRYLTYTLSAKSLIQSEFHYFTIYQKLEKKSCNHIQEFKNICFAY